MGFSPFFVPPAHTDWQPRSAGFAILTPISAARLAPPLRWICNPAWLPVADRARPPAVRTTAQPYTAGRPTPPATGKQQMRWICDPPLIPEIHHICNLLTAAAELALMSAWICNPGLPLKRICNSSAPQNSSAGRPKACSPRRWNQFLPPRRKTVVPGTCRAHRERR